MGDADEKEIGGLRSGRKVFLLSVVVCVVLPLIGVAWGAVSER